MNVLYYRPENMFAVRLPMTDTDASTTMDKIVTQIKTRFKVSTIVLSQFWSQNSVVTPTSIPLGMLLDRPFGNVVLRLVFKVGRYVENQFKAY